jgi:hypothetical protein
MSINTRRSNGTTIPCAVGRSGHHQLFRRSRIWMMRPSARPPLDAFDASDDAIAVHRFAEVRRCRCQIGPREDSARWMCLERPDIEVHFSQAETARRESDQPAEPTSAR